MTDNVFGGTLNLAQSNAQSGPCITNITRVQEKQTN